MDSKVFRSFLYGALGAVLTYATEFIASTDFGQYTALVTGLGTFLIAQAWVWLAKQPESTATTRHVDPDAVVAVDLTAVDARQIEDELIRRRKEQQDEYKRSLDPRTPTYALLAFLLLPACASAQFGDTRPPRAIIQGPSAAIPGEMVILDASTSEGASTFKWSISPELRGRKQLLEIDGGKRVQVASYGGRYVITLAVANEAGIDLLTWDLRIDGNAPCPPPEPSPGPTPDDSVPPAPSPTPVPDDTKPPPKPDVDPAPPRPIPVGEFGIAPKVAEIVAGINDPKRAEVAKVLADRVDALAAEIAAGVLTDVTTTVTRIGAAIKDLSPEWKSASGQFSAAMQLAYEQHKAGRLKVTTTGRFVDPSGWSTLLREIAVGVRGAK